MFLGGTKGFAKKVDAKKTFGATKIGIKLGLNSSWQTLEEHS